MSSRLQVGECFASRYEVKQLLGQGGMGEVYLVEDLENLGQEYALKVLLPHRGQLDRYRKRINAEIDILRRLKHDHIVRIFDFQLGHLSGEPGLKDPYIVMERLRGQSLAGWIEDKRPLTLGEVITMIKEVLAGLQHAHNLGIIHRDIKPDNIFISEKETSEDQTPRKAYTIKILDFGVAKDLESDISLTGSLEFPMIGTLHYMSPEQLKNETPSSQSDLYAIGAVLYELIRGYPPLATSELKLPSELTILPASIKIAWLHINAAVPTLDFDDELNSILQRLLAKDPKDRPRSAAAISAELELWSRRHPELTSSPLPLSLPKGAKTVQLIKGFNNLSHLSLIETEIERPSSIAAELLDLKPNNKDEGAAGNRQNKFSYIHWAYSKLFSRKSLMSLSQLIFTLSFILITLFVLVPFKQRTKDQTLDLENQQSTVEQPAVAQNLSSINKLHDAFRRSGQSESDDRIALRELFDINLREIQEPTQLHKYAMTLLRIGLERSTSNREKLAFKLLKRADQRMFTQMDDIKSRDLDLINERCKVYIQYRRWPMLNQLLSATEVLETQSPQQLDCLIQARELFKGGLEVSPSLP